MRLKRIRVKCPVMWCVGIDGVLGLNRTQRCLRALSALPEMKPGILENAHTFFCNYVFGKHLAL